LTHSSPFFIPVSERSAEAKAMLILNLPEREFTNSSHEVDALGGDDGKASKWLISADIDELHAEGNLEALRDLDRKQRILVRQYHLHHTRQELASQNPSRTYAWLNLLEAIREAIRSVWMPLRLN
jgi:hypothetical protein